MHEHGAELLAKRTVAIRFPDGDTQYWLTDRRFDSGERFEAKGRDWLIVDVAQADDHYTVSVRPAVDVEVAV
jgi:hypothetical protein